MLNKGEKMFAKPKSKAFQFDTANWINILISAGLSALIVFVGSLIELLPSVDTENGVIQLVITGVVIPAFVTLKQWLTDYASNR